MFAYYCRKHNCKQKFSFHHAEAIGKSEHVCDVYRDFLKAESTLNLTIVEAVAERSDESFNKIVHEVTAKFVSALYESRKHVNV